MRLSVTLLDSRLPGWGFPRWGSASAAGLDLHACLDAPLTLPPQAAPALVPAGFSLRFDETEWCGLILPRSGLGHRQGLVLGNGTGVIDADYEGPILVSAWNRNPVGEGAPITIEPGERIAQMVFTRIIRPTLEIRTGADEPASGEMPGRGAGGFGSTGR